MRLARQNSRLYRPIIAVWNLNEDAPHSAYYSTTTGFVCIEKFAKRRGIEYRPLKSTRYRLSSHAIILISQRNCRLLLKTAVHKRLFRNRTRVGMRFINARIPAEGNFDIDFRVLARATSKQSYQTDRETC